MSRRSSGRARRASGPYRLRASFVAVAFLASLFAGRLVQLQGVDANAYATMAQREGTRTVALPAERGSILDRFGAPLAESVDGAMLTADPTLTARHAREIAAILHSRLGLDYIDTVAALRTPNTRFAYVARRLPPARAESVVSSLNRSGYTGVFAARDPVRSYPAGNVAGNVVGFVGSDGAGLAGLEYFLDAKLAGHDGSQTYEVAPDGSQIPLGSSFLHPPRAGTDVALTLDRDLQWYTQRRLQEAVKSSAADSGVAVVLDVRTGQILALADFPSVDPANPTSAPKADLGSRAVQDVYEPGSVEKVLTAGALIDAGLVDPRTKITVPPTLQRSGHTIHDWFSHGTLHLTMTGVIAKSSNLGTVLASEQMPAATLHGYLHRFGLGQLPHTGLPGESSGLLPATKTWMPITRATIAFGQGMSVSAVQMAAAVAAIANGGVRVAPTVVKGFVGADGPVHRAPAPPTSRVISPRAAKAVTSMMEAVTGPNGTAPLAAIPGYRVAGKTGTSQRVDPACGCYHGVTLSFVGFAPADSPRFLTYVVLQNPSSGGGGGSTGGPVFHDIMSYALQKYAVAPTGSRPPKIPLTW